jgi:hypothetical protein
VKRSAGLCCVLCMSSDRRNWWRRGPKFAREPSRGTDRLRTPLVVVRRVVRRALRHARARPNGLRPQRGRCGAHGGSCGANLSVRECVIFKR